VEQNDIRFSLYNQTSVSKADEEVSEEQTEKESVQVDILDDPPEDLEQLAPEELLRVLPGDLEEADCTCRDEQSWRNLKLSMFPMLTNL
jgi:hypothetical protein